jgi:hypothetical protein
MIWRLEGYSVPRACELAEGCDQVDGACRIVAEELVFCSRQRLHGLPYAFLTQAIRRREELDGVGCLRGGVHGYAGCLERGFCRELFIPHRQTLRLETGG